MESFLISIVFLVFVLVLCLRLILPKAVRHELLAEIIHDGLKGLWHLLFGPRRVKITRDRKRGLLKSKKK